MRLELSTIGTMTTLAELLTGKCYVGIPANEWRGDPFQAALPCWDENWQMPTAKEIRSERLTLDLEIRKRIGRAI